ncbi:uncharacterized protein LOC121268901 [Juglans microcarpa x Juglans regia]|uniref:uncharacterized protein LOC121268901 n=1 Tax=Juglans microcarpa x Juglans regia TaxID=2249226 RepID=UPI001B7DD6EB|nr:uncharacterized protein LOC121268901 [Juglans microcarpa x Juglans regia]
MESEAPANFMLSSFPVSSFRATSWGDYWDMKTNESTAENGSAPVGLNLELGHGSNHRTKSCGFTVLQLQELQLQALIYKYMEAALPVPYHLLLPLWRSVASSLGGLNDAVPSGHTSLLGSSPCLGTIEVAWIPIQSLAGVEEQMGRSGGVARKLLHIKSTARGICKEAVSVQESLWHLLDQLILVRVMLIAQAPTSLSPSL